MKITALVVAIIASIGMGCFIAIALVYVVRFTPTDAPLPFSLFLNFWFRWFMLITMSCAWGGLVYMDIGREPLKRSSLSENQSTGEK
jgi:hypothetical protein